MFKIRKKFIPQTIAEVMNSKQDFIFYKCFIKITREMKTNLIFAILGCGSILFSALGANAQENAVVIEETAVTTTDVVECKTHYSSSWRDNWFIQIGAGASLPFVDYDNNMKDSKRHFTAVYNVGVGHWFSPYLGFRFSGYYGKIHYDYIHMNSAQMANLNFDIMWDMTSSVCGVNPDRVFSFIPFFGVGGTYTWDFKGTNPTIAAHHGDLKTREWILPVSAGFQFRFRLCKYVDFFAEMRASFYGDNFNNIVGGDPIECNLSAIGGLSFTIGGRQFKGYNPCDYLGYINQLNGQVNDLRGELATTAAALAAAEAQLPCPEVSETTIVESPLLSTVRFSINSAEITDREQVNVYNIAQWMKANPEAKVVVGGYADKDTGTAEYNMALSQRRAQAVIDMLTGEYGISSDRLSIKAYGSDTQPYPENDWNRIVIFAQ